VLPETLAALLADQTTSELIVVLDGADPESTILLEGLAKSDRRVRPVAIAARGAGGAGARQAGAELARGEILVFIDDDVVVEPGCVGGHAAWHADGARRVVLGYMPVQRGPVRRPRDLAAVFYEDGYERMCDAFDESPANVLLNFWAGNFSIKRADALRVGLFEPAFAAAYHSDRDFGLRCRSAGLEPVFDRSLRARHHVRRSWAQFQADSRAQGIGRLLVHTRHEDVLGPMVLDLSPGRYVRLMIHAGRRPRLRPLVQGALTCAAMLACAAHQSDLAVGAARLSRFIGFEQGAIEGMRKTAEVGSAAQRGGARNPV